MPSMTINYSAQEGQRIAAAIGTFLKLKETDLITPRSATASECKQFIIVRLKDFVHDVEMDEAKLAVTVTNIDPT